MNREVYRNKAVSYQPSATESSVLVGGVFSKRKQSIENARE
jgi:hypothetical protein